MRRQKPDMTISLRTTAAETRNHTCGSDGRRVGPKPERLRLILALNHTHMHVKRLREAFRESGHWFLLLFWGMASNVAWYSVTTHHALPVSDARVGKVREGTKMHRRFVARSAENGHCIATEIDAALSTGVY